MALARIHLYLFTPYSTYFFFYIYIIQFALPLRRRNLLFMMVLSPAPEGGLGASLRPRLMGLVQSDKQGGMRTYSSSNELTFSSIIVEKK